MTTLKYDSVLLLAFGGPTLPNEVRPFMDNVVRGKKIPAERYELVVDQYRQIGGFSPFNALTFRQQEGLAALLKKEGPPLSVYLGLRHWTPTIKEGLQAMANHGRKRALALILSPFQTEASWEVYHEAVNQAREAIGARAPTVDFIPPWFAHPLYSETMTARIRETGSIEHLVFTAHSIPMTMAADSPYEHQVQETAKRIATGLKAKSFSVAYQSRSGRPQDAWLEPDIRDEIRRLALLGMKKITVAPIGFVADHAEILFDLDIQAAAVAREVGVTLQRAQAANDHPLFVRMLAQLVRDHAA